MNSQFVKNSHNIAVFQHNAITEARYEMSALQKNIFYLLLSKLKEDDAKQTKYKISIKEINNSRNIRVRKEELYDAAQSLMESCLTLYDDGQRKFVTISILHSADYGDNVDKDDIIVEFDEKLHPYLVNVKSKFTAFTLSNALNLKSKYSKRIYEMLSQFKSTGVFRISINELKARFKLINSISGKEKYFEFSDFSKNVLEVAKKEINEHTDISFEYKTKKTGRKITDLEFKLHSKKTSKNISESSSVSLKKLPEPAQGFYNMLPISTQESSDLAALEKELCEKCEIDPVLAKRVVEKGPEKALRKLMNGLLKKQKAGDIDSLGGYSTTIFRAWLNGAEPKFEKTGIQAKHIPIKSNSQTNQIAALQTGVQKKLSDLGLGRNTVYGFIVKYGAELESLEKLENAISNVEKAIDRKEIESNPDSIFEELKRELNGEEKDFNEPLASESSERSNSTNSLGSLLALSISRPTISPSTAEQEQLSREKAGIWQELMGRFGMEEGEANEMVEEYSPKALNYATGKVVEVLQNQKTPQDPAIIAEELRKYASLWKL